MNIAMFTNTYVPHVGGVAGSVHQLTEDCRALGNDVLVVAPEFPDMPGDEEMVVRVPAIQNFNGSDFSVSLPAPIQLRDRLREFDPDILHVHHPYLLGDTALRISAALNTPLVFTYHTMYEKYTHYVPADSPLLKRFIIRLSTRFVNLCDHVIAPSESIRNVLKQRDIETPVTVIPTGVRFDRFSSGSGQKIRESSGIPQDAFVLGHVGRLAPEKNLKFLAQVAAGFLENHQEAHFLVAGDGPSLEKMQLIFDSTGVSDRTHFLGICKDQRLVNAYHAMDTFLFTSKSETQGMVLAEAMAAGCPVVALDAPGARDIVEHEQNGWLLDNENKAEFVNTLQYAAGLDSGEKSRIEQGLDETAREFSARNSAKKTLNLYQEMMELEPVQRKYDGDDSWNQILRSVKREWTIWENRVSAGVNSISGEEDNPEN